MEGEKVGVTSEKEKKPDQEEQKKTHHLRSRTSSFNQILPTATQETTEMTNTRPIVDLDSESDLSVIDNKVDIQERKLMSNSIFYGLWLS